MSANIEDAVVMTRVRNSHTIRFTSVIALSALLALTILARACTTTSYNDCVIAKLEYKQDVICR